MSLLSTVAPPLWAYPLPCRNFRISPFVPTSVWNTPVADNAIAQATTDFDGFAIGLSTFGWAAGGPSIYTATTSDPLVNIYYVPNFNETIYNGGAWKRVDNTAEIDAEIMDGTGTPPAADQLWAGTEHNTYSSQDASDYVLPATAKKRTDPYWSLQAYVPSDAVPALDVDGHFAVYQPNGWVLEVHSGIVLGNGDVVTNYASYSDPTGAGDGNASGRRASMIPNYAGVVLVSELAAGVIDHAIAIALGTDALTTAFVSPATAFDRNPAAYAGTIPMGARLAIPANTDLDSLSLETADGLTIATAAQKYGMIVTDASAPTAFIVLTETGGPAFSAPLERDLEKLL